MIPTQNAKVALPQAPVTDVVLTDKSHDPVLFGPTPIAAAFRYIQPSWRNYIMYVDTEARTGNDDARRYLRIWRALPPKEQRSVVPEQLCELAQVSAADLIAWVSRQVWTEGTASASMVLAFNKPRVLDAVATAALDPENGRAQELFMKSAGLLPSGNRGGGGGITIHNMPVASSGSVALAGSKSESSPVNGSGLRSMDDDIVGLSQIMQHEQHGKSRAELEPDDDDEDDSEDEEDDD